MKISIRGLSGPLAAAIILSGAFLASCNKLPSESGQGTLRWTFSPTVLTKSSIEVPDTDAFILTVANSAGEILYKGAYGDSPEKMLVNPGTYSVSAVSREFSKPEFDAPQFGDEQVVVVMAGTGTTVVLECSQLNCGLKLRTSRDFADSFPGATLSVESREGSLDYGNSPDRTGFFKPGLLSVYLNDGSTSTLLLTRNLEAREMLTLGMTCPSPAVSQEGRVSELSIKVDTVRTWHEDEYTIGSQSGDSGVSLDNAYSVSQARSHAGEKAVWVCGYIVGGDLSSSKNGIKFDPPFNSMTCLAIASRSSVTEKSSCMSVQLTKGSMREVLNLVDHPDLIGRKVYLKGDIEASYYGIPGMKNLTECKID